MQALVPSQAKPVFLCRAADAKLFGHGNCGRRYRRKEKKEGNLTSTFGKFATPSLSDLRRHTPAVVQDNWELRLLRAVVNISSQRAYSATSHQNSGRGQILRGLQQASVNVRHLSTRTRGWSQAIRACSKATVVVARRLPYPPQAKEKCMYKLSKSHNYTDRATQHSNSSRL